MNGDEFIKKLGVRYKEPLNEQIVIDLKTYFKKQIFTSKQFELLYDILADHYEYDKFPSRALVKKLWEKYELEYSQPADVERVSQLQPDHVMEKNCTYPGDEAYRTN